MIDILIEPTPVTPYVKVDSQGSHIVFSGKSSPANSLHFYHPLMNKINSLFASTEKPITIDLSFRYFNTSSSKCLFDLFKMFRNLQRQGKTLVINWYYEEDDDDMMETGEDYADLLNLDFNYIEVEEIEDIPAREAV